MSRLHDVSTPKALFAPRALLSSARSDAMSNLIDRADAPAHLWAIRELDFSGEVAIDPLQDEWFTLALWTRMRGRDHAGVETQASRQTALICPGSFPSLFDALDGGDLHNLGRPTASLRSDGRGGSEYLYRPFHEFMVADVEAEPVAFLVDRNQRVELDVNPDVTLFFELERRQDEGVSWWDPRRAVEAVRKRSTESGQVDDLQIRRSYLRRYLQARQSALLVEHYRHRHLFALSETAIGQFVKEDVVVGSGSAGVKAFFQNWGLRTDTPDQHFLQRRLHLWYVVEPDPVDLDEPWADDPPFDPRTFTFPTRSGPVAPARWKTFRGSHDATYAGATCEFMDRIYFRQEVLQKYQATTGFDVDDDGYVRCRHYWALNRSTSRVGNELLATAIGDFAEGVPFEEWPHWQQFAVPPPSPVTGQDLASELQIPIAVNELARALEVLNRTSQRLAAHRDGHGPVALWSGAGDSLAVKQLKWVYPSPSTDDEFLKRATLLSTFAIDELKPEALRVLLRAHGDRLHEKDGKALGSRNLLQRLVLAESIAHAFNSVDEDVAVLVVAAEGGATAAIDTDVVRELRDIREHVREAFGPLAFLYDLRTHGGMAHPPSPARAGDAAASLGLPRSGWHRADFLELLRLVTESVDSVSTVLTDALARSPKPARG
jgi:hypothetical protein